MADKSEELELQIDALMTKMDNLSTEVAMLQADASFRESVMESQRGEIAQLSEALRELDDLPRTFAGGNGLRADVRPDRSLTVTNIDRILHRFRPYSSRGESNLVYISQGYIFKDGTRYHIKDSIDPDDSSEVLPFPLDLDDFEDETTAYFVAVFDENNADFEFEIEPRKELELQENETLLFTSDLMTQGVSGSRVVTAMEFHRHQLSDIYLGDNNRPHAFEPTVDDDSLTVSVTGGLFWYNNEWIEVAGVEGVGSTATPWVVISIVDSGGVVTGELSDSVDPKVLDDPLVIPVLELTYNDNEVITSYNRHLVGDDNGMFVLAKEYEDEPEDTSDTASVGTSVRAARADHVHIGGEGLNKVKVTEYDTTADYLDNSVTAGGGITKQVANPAADEKLVISADVQKSIVLDPSEPTVNNRKLQLDGDLPTPGNDYYYGTNGSGTKGWYTLGGSTDKFVAIDAGDGSPDYLANKITNSIVSTGSAIQLSGDNPTPGNTYYYGTDGSGTKGWYSLGSSTDEKVKGSVSDPTAGYLDAKVAKSISVISDKLELVGDSASPGNEYYYGTNGSGTKGWYQIPDADDEKVRLGVNILGSPDTAGFLNAKVGGSLEVDELVPGDNNPLVILDGDEASPAADHVYGTDAGGVRGWQDISSYIGVTQTEMQWNTGAGYQIGGSAPTPDSGKFWYLGSLATESRGAPAVLWLVAKMEQMCLPLGA